MVNHTGTSHAQGLIKKHSQRLAGNSSCNYFKMLRTLPTCVLLALLVAGPVAAEGRSLVGRCMELVLLLGCLVPDHFNLTVVLHCCNAPTQCLWEAGRAAAGAGGRCRDVFPLSGQAARWRSHHRTVTGLVGVTP